MKASEEAENGDVSNKANDFPKTQEGGWGWVVVTCSFMIHIICGGIMYTFSVFSEQFIQEFKESKSKTSLVSSLMIGSYSITGPIIGWLTRRYGCRAITITGSLFMFFGLGISALATNITFLIFTAGICTGTGIGLIFLPAVVCISFYFEKQRALATGIATSGASVGNFILPPFIQWMIDEMGWRSAMLIVAGLALNCSVFGAFFRPVENRRSNKQKLSNDQTTSKGDSAQIHHSKLVKNAAFHIFVCSTFCACFGLYVPYVFFEDRAVDLHLGKATEISYLISIMGISNTLGRIIFGFLSDRPWIKTLWLYSTGITLCGVATAVSCLCVSYPQMAFYAAVFGATSGAYIPLRPIILADFVGLDKLTTAFGLMLLSEGIATSIGSPVTGWLYDRFGSYNPGFLLSGIVIAVSGVILVFIPCCTVNNNSPSIKKEPQDTASDPC